ncbi:MAG: DUF1272 domain-containing protein [Colwelliaceae bacterium]|jgi:hypothetical protein|nr:DUF1272 domain-containing protein [Colwelliaceae bacterium]
MLELRPNCECCNKDLSPQSSEVYICTFECTFCLKCTQSILNFVCPNCSGNLVQRPIRPTSALISNPASTVRIIKKNGCTQTT